MANLDIKADAVARELALADDGAARRRRQLAVAAVALLLLLAVVPLIWGSSFNLARYGVALAYIMAAIGLNLAFGYTGELVIGHAVIMAVAAYAAGIVSALFGWGGLAAIPVGVVAGVLVGLLMMLPGLRVQGWYLGLITLFAVLVLPRIVILSEEWTGGEFGLTGIKTLDILGFRLADWMTFELTLLVFALVWLASTNLVRSGWGHRFRALRDARRAAEAVGIDLQRTRFVVYLVSAVPAALAGVLLAYTERFVNAESFGIGLTLLVLTGVVLGGTGTTWGPLIGMAPLVALSFWVGPFSPYNAVFLGVGLMIGVVVFPDGLVPALAAPLRRLAERTMRDRTPTLESSHDVTVDRPVFDVRRPQGSESIIAAEGVVKRFGGVLALDHVDFQLAPGRLCGLVGPNGSGKSTFLNALSGFASPDSGTLRLCGQDVSGVPVHLIARVGVGRTFQVPQLVDECTALENIEIGLLTSAPDSLIGAIARTPGVRRQAAWRRERALAAFRAVGLPPASVRSPVSDLPLGLKRIVEVARAIAPAPSLLMLDEPAAGLNDEERTQLGELLRHLKAGGMTILVVEHNVPFVMSFCDELVLLESGRVTCRADLSEKLPDRLTQYLNYAPDQGSGRAVA